MGYPFRDLREFIEELKHSDDLIEINAEVDWHLEIAAIGRRVLDIRGPALWFQNIKGAGPGYSFFTGTFGTLSRYALSLGLPRMATFQEVTRAYRERVKHPIKPKLIEREMAPCKENIYKGEDVDLLKLPTPLWHHRDGGRYLGTLGCLSAKDPDSDWVNVGLYRMMIHDSRRLGLFLEPGQHAAAIYEKYESLRMPMPVAISVGQDPVNVIAAFGGFEAGISEWEMAGALRGQPVELVECEAVDLAVPATAEIIIEGQVPPLERLEEGPFGEYTGYYGGTRAPRPYIEVICMTLRNGAIHTGLLEGKPMQENNVMASVEHSALLEKTLNDDLKLGVRAVFEHPWMVCHGLVISMTPRYPGHVLRVAHAVWASKIGLAHDLLFVVGEDIDPADLDEVMWALCTRCKPDRDIIVIPRERTSALWPCLSPVEREAPIGSKVLFDATFPAEWPKEWVPPVSDWRDYPEEIRRKVETRWKEYGFFNFGLPFGREERE